MRFIVLALTVTLASASQSATNFRNTCSTASNQLSSLAQSIAKIKAVADDYGHSAISAKCDEASQHLIIARTSWTAISTGFGNFPWEARSSPHAGRCQNRLNSCGASLKWIYSRSEVSFYPNYHPHISTCKSGYSSCQNSCGKVWNWPSPPGFKPKPSGYYRRHRRESTKTVCPLANEIACPISSDAPGYECVDTQTEITSCGGCVVDKTGENCLTIEGADEVGCDKGQCRVFSTKPGFELDSVTQRPVLR